MIEFILGADQSISMMPETRPMFMSKHGPTLDYIHMAFGFAYLVFPVVFIWLRRSHTQTSIAPAILWFLLATFLISFAQKRFSHFFAPGFVFSCWVVVERLPRIKNGIAAAIVLVLLTEPAVAYRQVFLRAVSKSTRETIQLVRKLEIEVQGKPKAGVSAPPNIGNLIIYLAELPVVTSTFFYKEYLSFDLKLREIRQGKEFLDFLQDHSIGYLVAADDVRYRTMLYRLFEEKEKLFSFEKREYQPCSQPYLQFAYDRLACTGQPSDGLSPIGLWLLERNSFSLWRRISLYKISVPNTQD